MPERETGTAKGSGSASTLRTAASGEVSSHPIAAHAPRRFSLPSMVSGAPARHATKLSGGCLSWRRLRASWASPAPPSHPQERPCMIWSRQRSPAFGSFHSTGRWSPLRGLVASSTSSPHLHHGIHHGLHHAIRHASDEAAATLQMRANPHNPRNPLSLRRALAAVTAAVTAARRWRHR